MSCHSGTLSCCLNRPPKFCTNLSILAENLLSFEFLGLFFTIYAVAVRNGGLITANNVSYNIDITGQYFGSISFLELNFLNQNLTTQGLSVDVGALPSISTAVTLLLVLGEDSAISATFRTDTPPCSLVNNSASASADFSRSVITTNIVVTALAAIRARFPNISDDEILQFELLLQKIMNR